jgi:UDP-2,3-diacylglucosamine pyrophosphatase LpxH
MGREDIPAGLRSVLISDLHLGSYRCNARALSSFLSSVSTETLYLVGDAIDLWSLRARAPWPREHVAVLRQLGDLLQRGTRVVLLPGNHDESLLQLANVPVPGLEICRDTVLETRSGLRYLVLHGHEQDRLFGSTTRIARTLSSIGERIGELAHNCGLRAAFLPRSADTDERARWVKRALNGTAMFERALEEETRRRGFHGVVCGHTHTPFDRQLGDLHYLNCGDWIRACTAVVETQAGELRLLRWREQAAMRSAPSCISSRTEPALAIRHAR